MKTLYITQNETTVSEDSHIVDLGEVENATIFIAENITAKYTIIPSAGILERHILLQGNNNFLGNGVIVEDTNLTIQAEVVGDKVESLLDILAIATDNSKISVQGEAKVDAPYKKLNIRVDQVNILIGENTNVRGVPRLEIATNDIEGGHSCKIHRLHGDALFYLESHGLDSKEAEVMIINSEILKHLNTLPPEMREESCLSIHKKLLLKK